jgi:hypothetical protein
MKRLMKNVATLLVCLISISVFAGSSPDVSVVYVGKKTIALYLGHAEDNVQMVRLKDVNGSVLLTDRVKSAEASGRRYNLANLPAGKYTLMIENDGRTVMQPMTITSEAINLAREDMKTLFAPAVRMHGQKLDYTLLCLNPAAVSIEIIDDEGRKNYNATNAEHGSVQRRFDITALSPGTYTIVTRIQNDQFEKRYTEIFTVGNAVASR